MSRVQLIIGFLGIAFIAQVAAHGHLSVPTARDYMMRQDQKNAPNEFPLISDFVCRNYTALPPNLRTTLTAGSSTPISWSMEAAHPGDCFAYISYDGDSVPDTRKKWFKIASFPQCNLQNTKTLSLNIPSYLPSCEHCILRWEWYALHLQSINIVEFYAQCADVKIIGNSNGQLPSPMVTIPGHLPMDAKHYRGGWGTESKLTGPPVATIGGAAYSCASAYDNSCNVPSPTNNPCVISTQRCVSDSTYQACGIGATSTIWYDPQSCQTGLVCISTPDGAHISCVRPSQVPPTYSPPVAAPTPVAVPTPAPVPTPVPVPTPAPVPAPTPVAVPTPSSNGCTLGNMRCVGDSSYQTCANSNVGAIWAAAQSCQTGMYCSPSGVHIYCASTKPSTPVAVPAPTPVVVPAPTPVPTTPTPAPVPTPTPVPSTPAPTPVPTPTPTPVPTPSGSCTVGYQRCVVTETGSYETCYGTPGNTRWVGQKCHVGLSCVPSATANNIYCY